MALFPAEFPPLPLFAMIAPASSSPSIDTSAAAPRASSWTPPWAPWGASLVLHATLVLAAGWAGPGWRLILLPPPHDLAAAAERRGAQATIVVEWTPDSPEEQPEKEPVDNAVRMSVETPRLEPRPSETAPPLRQVAVVVPQGELPPAETPPWDEAPPLPTQRAEQKSMPPPAAELADAPPPRPREPNPMPPAAPAVPGTIDSRPAQGAQTTAPPRAIFSPEPIYPPQLLAARVQGLALVRIRVLPSGLVGGAAIARSSGYAAFDHSARQAVSRWRFEPLPHAPPAGVEVVVPVRFAIAP